MNRLARSDEEQTGHLGGSRGLVARSVVPQPEVEEQLRELLGMFEARMIIEQAKGVLMGRSNISASQTFKLLQTQSQHTNTKLREVAAALIAPPPTQIPPPSAGASRMPAPTPSATRKAPDSGCARG